MIVNDKRTKHSTGDSMMTVHQTTSIIIIHSGRRNSARIELFFDKVPTNEQLVEATRFMLSEVDPCSQGKALDIMDAVKELGVPAKKMQLKHNGVGIFHSTDFLIRIHEKEDM